MTNEQLLAKAAHHAANASRARADEWVRYVEESRIGDLVTFGAVTDRTRADLSEANKAVAKAIMEQIDTYAALVATFRK